MNSFRAERVSLERARTWSSTAVYTMPATTNASTMAGAIRRSFLSRRTHIIKHEAPRSAARAGRGAAAAPVSSLRVSEWRDDDRRDGEVERVGHKMDGDRGGAGQEGRHETGLRDGGDGRIARLPNERRRKIAGVGRELYEASDVDLHERRRDE